MSARLRGIKMMSALVLAAAMLMLASCVGAGTRELVDMKMVDVGDHVEVLWEDRSYVPFCVVSKKDMGEQIGYCNGDRDDRISEYTGYPPEEWLVSWMTTDGGAILLREKNVTVIPDGLTDEYGYK